MVKWWDFIAALGFAWLIWTNVTLAAISFISGNVVISMLCGYAAYAVYNGWDDYYIPFRVKLEDNQ